MAPGAMQWTDTIDKALLLLIIARGTALSGAEWPHVAAAMQAKGYQVSASACKQHYNKLRKENGIASVNARNGGSSQPASATKRTAFGKSKSKGMTDEDLLGNQDDDEEWAGEQTPSKRKKRETGLKKEEALDEDEGFVSQDRASFKMEETDENGELKDRQVVVLDDDDLYDDDEA